MGARKEEQRGTETERRQMGVSGTEGRTGHTSYAAEEPFIWKMKRDGTRRNSRTSDSLASIQIGTLRPSEDLDGASSDILQTTVSIVDPANNNHPVYFSSTDIWAKSRS